MARNTIAAARSELYNLLVSDTTKGTPVPSLAAVGVIQVYPYEPLPGDMGAVVTITVQTEGMDETEYRFNVRAYVHVSLGAKVAQDTMDAVMLAVDRIITSGFGLSNWRVRFEDQLGAFVATNLLEAGREDSGYMGVA